MSRLPGSNNLIPQSVLGIRGGLAAMPGPSQGGGPVAQPGAPATEAGIQQAQQQVAPQQPQQAPPQPQPMPQQPPANPGWVGDPLVSQVAGQVPSVPYTQPQPIKAGFLSQGMIGAYSALDDRTGLLEAFNGALGDAYRLKLGSTRDSSVKPGGLDKIADDVTDPALAVGGGAVAGGAAGAGLGLRGFLADPRIKEYRGLGPSYMRDAYSDAAAWASSPAMRETVRGAADLGARESHRVTPDAFHSLREMLGKPARRAGVSAAHAAADTFRSNISRWRTGAMRGGGIRGALLGAGMGGLGYLAAGGGDKSAADTSEILKQLLPTLLGGAGGAAYGAYKKPGGSRTRGALIGGMGGAGAGAAFTGGMGLLHSDMGDSLHGTTVGNTALLGATGLGLHGGLALGRQAADGMGLGREDNKSQNDLREIDVMDKRHGLLSELFGKRSDSTVESGIDKVASPIMALLGLLGGGALGAGLGGKAVLRGQSSAIAEKLRRASGGFASQGLRSKVPTQALDSFLKAPTGELRGAGQAMGGAIGGGIGALGGSAVNSTKEASIASLAGGYLGGVPGAIAGGIGGENLAAKFGPKLLDMLQRAHQARGVDSVAKSYLGQGAGMERAWSKLIPDSWLGKAMNDPQGAKQLIHHTGSALGSVAGGAAGAGLGTGAGHMLDAAQSAGGSLFQKDAGIGQLLAKVLSRGAKAVAPMADDVASHIPKNLFGMPPMGIGGGDASAVAKYLQPKRFPTFGNPQQPPAFSAPTPANIPTPPLKTFGMPPMGDIGKQSSLSPFAQGFLDKCIDLGLNGEQIKSAAMTAMDKMNLPEVAKELEPLIKDAGGGILGGLGSLASLGGKIPWGEAGKAVSRFGAKAAPAAAKTVGNAAKTTAKATAGGWDDAAHVLNTGPSPVAMANAAAPTQIFRGGASTLNNAGAAAGGAGGGGGAAAGAAAAASGAGGAAGPGLARRTWNAVSPYAQTAGGALQGAVTGNELGGGESWSGALSGAVMGGAMGNPNARKAMMRNPWMRQVAMPMAARASLGADVGMGVDTALGTDGAAPAGAWAGLASGIPGIRKHIPAALTNNGRRIATGVGLGGAALGGVRQYSQYVGENAANDKLREFTQQAGFKTPEDAMRMAQMYNSGDYMGLAGGMWDNIDPETKQKLMHGLIGAGGGALLGGLGSYAAGGSPWTGALAGGVAGGVGSQYLPQITQAGQGVFGAGNLNPNWWGGGADMNNPTPVTAR